MGQKQFNKLEAELRVKAINAATGLTKWERHRTIFPTSAEINFDMSSVKASIYIIRLNIKGIYIIIMYIR